MNGHASTKMGDISDSELFNPVARPRSQRVIRNQSAASQQSQDGSNPFPEDQIPLTPDPGVEKKFNPHDRADIEACKKGCVSAEDVKKSFEDRAAHLESVRSIDANRGSNKTRDYHRFLDLDLKKR